jgi:hypothetical protein
VEYPKWITLEEQCLFCYKFSLKIKKVELTEDSVFVKYECNNKSCRCLKDLNKKSEYGIVFNSKRKVKLYKKFLKEKKEQKWK